MNNKWKPLDLKQKQYQFLKQKFNKRQDQRSLSQALVYLKLRQYDCDSKKALVFSKKKEKGIDGTIQKDGPPGFKNLQVIKPQNRLVNGWLRGQKLKYLGTTGYSQNINASQSKQKQNITQYNRKSRQLQEQLRKTRSKSIMSIDINKPRQSIQKINFIKQQASKERQNRNMYIQIDGLKLDQTTKNFFKQTQRINQQGLIVKLGAFEDLINNNSLVIQVDEANLKGKSLTRAQIQGKIKRNKIIQYQQRLSQNQIQTKSVPKIYRKNSLDHKQIHFSKKQIKPASNPLILLKSKQLKQQLGSNYQKFNKTLTKYSGFYNNMQKSIKLQFLDKKRFSQSEFHINKLKNINT